MSLSRTLAALVYTIHHLWVGTAVLASLVWLLDYFGTIELAPPVISLATHWMACSMAVLILGPVLAWDGTPHYRCAPLYLRRAIQVAAGEKVGGLFVPVLKRYVATYWSDTEFALTLNLALLLLWLILLLG